MDIIVEDNMEKVKLLILQKQFKDGTIFITPSVREAWGFVQDKSTPFNLYLDGELAPGSSGVTFLETVIKSEVRRHLKKVFIISHSPTAREEIRTLCEKFDIPWENAV